MRTAIASVQQVKGPETSGAPRRRWWWPCLLFLLMIPVYHNSIPARFNTAYNNRCFFDSDGEFILRQFDQGKTFTHNDHLLYHITARWLYTHADRLPLVKPNPLKIHKQLSVVAGAAGVALLFAIGLMLTGRTLPSLLTALFTGGCAGYWFFAATIDTYLPSLVFCILSLGFGLRALQRHRLVDYAGLGTAMGLAVLFRTDAILLGTLGLVALIATRQKPAGWITCGGFFLIVGIGGYAALAHHYYHVPWLQVPAWAAGHANRPETLQAQWGALRNLGGPALAATALNHTLYTVLLPGVSATRSASFIPAFTATAGGTAALAIYLLVMGGALLRCAWKSATDRLASGAWLIAILWVATRVVFYCWWDPKDPFLFAVLSLPAWWLILTTSITRNTHGLPQTKKSSRGTMALALLTLAVWGHNAVNLIYPLQHM
jgi:hypothetical protein